MTQERNDFGFPITSENTWLSHGTSFTDDVFKTDLDINQNHDLNEDPNHCRAYDDLKQYLDTPENRNVPEEDLSSVVDTGYIPIPKKIAKQ